MESWKGSTHVFCNKPIENYEEIIDYIDEINVDHKAMNQKDKETGIDAEEVEKMKIEIMELKNTTSNQLTTISSLQSDLQNMIKDNQKIRKQIEPLKSQFLAIPLLQSKLKKAKNENQRLNEKNISLKCLSTKNMKQISCQFSSKYDLKGILNKFQDGVSISAGCISDPDHPVSCIMKYNNDTFLTILHALRNQNHTISLNLILDHQRSLIYILYYIRTNVYTKYQCHHPKTWRIEGSNDDIKWIPLDKRNSNSDLNGPYKEMHFICQLVYHENQNNKFMFIRYVQEDSWQKNEPFHICITFFEL